MEKPPSLDNKYVTPSWQQWFAKLWIVAGSVDNSGTTAQRPTQDLFVGRPYFDTTLGKPIWLKTVTAGSGVWVDAAGVTV